MPIFLTQIGIILYYNSKHNYQSTIHCNENISFYSTIIEYLFFFHHEQVRKKWNEIQMRKGIIELCITAQHIWVWSLTSSIWCVIKIQQNNKIKWNCTSLRQNYVIRTHGLNGATSKIEKNYIFLNNNLFLLITENVYTK